MKGGIDFLIRSSKQIELQLNLKPCPPPPVYPRDEEHTWRRETGEGEWLLFLPFFCFLGRLDPLPLYITLSFQADLTPLRHSADGFCDESGSEVYFIARSACKESSISLVWSHFKRWRGVLTSLTPHPSLVLLVPPAAALFFYLFLWTKQDL